MPLTQHRTFTLYVRAAKHPRFKEGQRIEASMRPNQKPLTIGQGYAEQAVHTAFFKLDIKVPVEMLRPDSIPTFEVEIDPEDVTTITPTVEVEAVRPDLQ